MTAAAKAAAEATTTATKKRSSSKWPRTLLVGCGVCLVAASSQHRYLLAFVTTTALGGAMTTSSDSSSLWKLYPSMSVPVEADTARFCSPWQDENTDDWWIHHPDWYVDGDNSTHTCFRQLPSDTDKAKFMRRLYEIQWKTTADCSPQSAATYLSSPPLQFALKKWTRQWQPIVEGLARTMELSPHEPFHLVVAQDTYSCFGREMYHDCFFLPLSACSSNPATKTTAQAVPPKEDDRELELQEDTLEYRWYWEYVIRPRHEIRQRMVEKLADKPLASAMDPSCAILHMDDQWQKAGSVPNNVTTIVNLATEANAKQVILVSDSVNLKSVTQQANQTTHPETKWFSVGHGFRGTKQVISLLAILQWIHTLPCQKVLKYHSHNATTEETTTTSRQQVLSTYMHWELPANNNKTELNKPKKKKKRTSNHVSTANSNNNPSSTSSLVDQHQRQQEEITPPPEPIAVHSLPLSAEFSDPFCVQWDVPGVDEWWTHHPHWEMGPYDNATHQCSQPIHNDEKAQFMKELYRVQFVDGNCSNVITKRIWNSGWGSDFGNVADGLLHAKTTGQPVQMELERWHYADPGLKRPGRPTTTIACEKPNMFCYFLEISKCPPQKESWDGNYLIGNMKRAKEYPWYVEFASRPQSWLRKKVSDFIRQQQYFQTPCAVMHVRRGDVIQHKQWSRRYHAIHEYLDYAEKVHVPLHDNILLLTDDQNAIVEATTNFPERNWMFIDRPRIEAKDAKWEQHLPSDDPIFEMTVLLSIFQMVKRCDQIVFSTSNFADQLVREMKSNTSRAIYRMDIDTGKIVYGWENNQTQNISDSFSSSS